MPTRTQRRSAGAGRARRLLRAGVLVGLAGACNPGPSGPPVARPDDTMRIDPLLAQRIDEAASAAEEAPRDARARRELAMVYDANDLWELARSTYEACVALDERDVRAWYHLARMHELAEPERALVALDRMLALQDNYAPSHRRRGYLLFRLGRTDEAEAAFRRATDLAPREASGWLGLARVHLERDEPRQAIDCLVPVLERNPRERFANGLQARAWSRLGRERRAASALRREERAGKATEADPWAAEVQTRATGLWALVETARTRLAAGQVADALAILEPLHAERPAELGPLHLLAQALIEDGRPARALELLDAGRVHHAEHYRLELVTGRALTALGRPRRALPHLERATALNPTLSEAHTALGEARLQLGLLEEAQASFATALEHGQRSLRDRILLGRVQLKRGRGAEAVETFRSATDSFPNSALAWAHLAEAQATAGRVEEARASLRRAEEHDPDLALLETVRASLRALDGSC